MEDASACFCAIDKTNCDTFASLKPHNSFSFSPIHFNSPCLSPIAAFSTMDGMVFSSLSPPPHSFTPPMTCSLSIHSLNRVRFFFCVFRFGIFLFFFYFGNFFLRQPKYPKVTERYPSNPKYTRFRAHISNTRCV